LPVKSIPSNMRLPTRRCEVSLQPGPSQWAIEKFGEDYAEALWRLLPKTIATAVSLKIEAQQASKLEKNTTYGGAWPTVHTQIADTIGSLGGIKAPVTPKGSQAPFIAVNGHLLVPFDYGKRASTKLTDRSVTRKLNKTLKGILRQHGPDVPTGQLPLDFEILQSPETGAYSESIFPAHVDVHGVVIVYFAANPQVGLLSVGWGEAALGDDEQLAWQHTEWILAPNWAGT
jgi:hypothetical protein